MGKITTAFATFIVLGLVARNYGEGGVGTFTLALAYLGIFYLLADFGFNAEVLKRLQSTVSSLQTEWNGLLGTRILWSAILVVLAVGLLPLWPFTTPLFSKSIYFGCLAIIASAIFTTCNLIFQSKLRYEWSVLASSLGTVISLGIFLFLAAKNFPVSQLLFGHLLGWFTTAAVALFLVKKILPAAFPVFDKQYAVNLFKSSWPIAATLAVNVVYFRADAFMISYFKGVSDVGIYNVAYSVFQSALVLPTFIMNAYYPLMLESLKDIKFVGLELLGLAGVGTLATLALAPLMIKILTGGGFSGSALSLQILSLGFPAYFLSSLLMWILVTKGRYKIMLLVYIVGLLLNFCLNLIYIPTASFIAAAWITDVSEYLILVMQVVVLFSERRKS